MLYRSQCVQLFGYTPRAPRVRHSKRRALGICLRLRGHGRWRHCQIWMHWPVCGLDISVDRPQVEVRVTGGERANGKRLDLRESHRPIAVKAVLDGDTEADRLFARLGRLRSDALSIAEHAAKLMPEAGSPASKDGPQ